MVTHLPWSMSDLADAIADILYPVSANELASLCDSLGMAQTDLQPMSSKRQYVRARMRALPRDRVEEIAGKVVTEFLRVAEFGSYRGNPIAPQWLEKFETLKSYIQARTTPSQRLNLVFATQKKPDIVIVDVPGNRIAARDDGVLIYDEAIDHEGLTIGRLKAWWIGKKGDTESLYPRLKASLGSRAEDALLHFYYRTFAREGDAEKTNTLPALLPQVWLQYDPLTRAERGGLRALPSQRLDFLMFARDGRKIVIEVDGPKHIEGQGTKSGFEVYQEQLALDRGLQLDGYEVYRFGSDELSGPSGTRLLHDFFSRLNLHPGTQ